MLLMKKLLSVPVIANRFFLEVEWTEYLKALI